MGQRRRQQPSFRSLLILHPRRVIAQAVGSTVESRVKQTQHKAAHLGITLHSVNGGPFFLIRRANSRDRAIIMDDLLEAPCQLPSAKYARILDVEIVEARSISLPPPRVIIRRGR